MSAMLHPLNIVTLATWLSVAGFGVVGLLVHPVPSRKAAREEPTEVRLVFEDISLGSDLSPPAGESASEPVEVEPLPVPPELPSVAETEPLPEIPDFPVPAPGAGDAAPAPARTPTRGGSAGRASSAARTSGRSGNSRGGGSASGMSNASRIAAGRMPAPTYPPYSRRNHQEGTVVVEFTVDSSGKVVSARAKQPCRWPLLNNEAVSTVYLWRFPPGGVMTLQRPIVFTLR